MKSATVIDDETLRQRYARGDNDALDGYRSEFLQRVRTSQTLAGQLTKHRQPQSQEP